MYGDFPGGSDGKESACNAGDLGLIPRSGRSPGEGNDSSILAWNILWTEYMHIYVYYANGFCQLITYLGYLSLSPYTEPPSLFRVCIASYSRDGP